MPLPKRVAGMTAAIECVDCMRFLRKQNRKVAEKSTRNFLKSTRWSTRTRCCACGSPCETTT